MVQGKAKDFLTLLVSSYFFSQQRKKLERCCKSDKKSKGKLYGADESGLLTDFDNCIRRWVALLWARGTRDFGMPAVYILRFLMATPTPCRLIVDIYNKTLTYSGASLCCSSQPSMVHWLSSSIFPFCSVGRCPAMVTSDQISTSTSPRPPNPYIF